MKRDDLIAFFKKEHQNLTRYVRYRLNETAEMDAEDIVQDVFVSFLGRADLTVPLEQLAAYIYRSIKNRMIDLFRTKKDTVSLFHAGEKGGGSMLDLLSDINPNALQVLQSQEGKELLFTALDRLTDMERKVVVAHEIEGMPFKAMVEMFGVPQNTLLSHKARAMHKLKEHFKSAKEDNDVENKQK